MDSSLMHKSLLLQQGRYIQRNNRKGKENDRVNGRSEMMGANAQQKFKSLLQKQKNNLYPQQLKQMKPPGKENHSFVNISDKENQMVIANNNRERQGTSKFARTENYDQNGGINRNPNLNVSISNHCQVFPQEKESNLTSIHSLNGVDEKQKGANIHVFNNNSSKNSQNKALKNNLYFNSKLRDQNSKIEEETYEVSNQETTNIKKLTSLSTRDKLSDDKSSISKTRKALENIYIENDSIFTKSDKSREACDPMEFCLDNIGNYYDRLVREKGKTGSIACGGDIFEVQKCLKQNMRVILFDWLLDLCQKWKMKLRTFVITITFTDAVLMRCTVTKEIFQLVGLACLFITGKFEEIYPPSLEEYLESCNNAYSREQLLQIETIILNSIQFNLVILNHLDILELNLKQRMTINSKKVKIYHPDFSPKEQEIITKVNQLSEMFLMICLYDHKVHMLNMNNVVDFCIINALRFVDLQGNEFHYKGISSNLLGEFSLKRNDLSVYLKGLPGLSIEEFAEIEGVMKGMMKTVFDSRQYSIIIKYRQFFVKTLRTYFDMI